MYQNKESKKSAVDHNIFRVKENWIMLTDPDHVLGQTETPEEDTCPIWKNPEEVIKRLMKVMF